MTTKKASIAVIQFPGTNCEYETVRAVEACGMNATIVRWNAQADVIRQYDGYVLPGGFSFQDRVRSGAIAAKLSLIERLEEANDQGKPILGICNGCQILAETGLVPGLNNKELLIALTYNHERGKRVGFICDWVYVKVNQANRSMFTAGFSDGDVLPIPVNHGEGCFTFESKLADTLSEHASFHYCTQDGDIVDKFPTNPNGSMLNLAGISNEKGNVFAMMPHPERSIHMSQIPVDIQTTSPAPSDGDINGSQLTPWASVFAGLKNYILEKV